MDELGGDLDLASLYKLPSGDWEAKTDKIRCSLFHGCRICWYYEDDKKFAEEVGDDPRCAAPYGGIVIAAPDIEMSRYRELGIDQCVVVVDESPTEKCDPLCEWVALARLLDNDELVEVLCEKDKTHLRMVR